MKRLIAIGDIHGCLENLQNLTLNVLKIAREDRLILLGDYIDRGENSKGVIDFIMNLADDGYNVIPLLGNHEAMLLEAVDTGDPLLWFMNGGGETLRSFGVTSPENIPLKYIDFLRKLTYYYSIGKYLFVHAGFNDSATDPFTDTRMMLWTRSDIYTNPVFDEKIIVHGHNPIKVEYCKYLNSMKSRVINIDTGCVYYEGGYGKLTGIELYTGKLFFA